MVRPLVVPDLGTVSSASTVTDVTTVEGAVERALRYLSPFHRSDVDVLAASITADDTSISLSYDNGSIRAGSVIVVGFEAMRVANRSGNTAVVVRGHFGTTRSGHAAGDVVDVEPRFPRPFVFDEVKAEILSWPSSVFRVLSVETSPPTPCGSVIDIVGAGEVLHLLGVFMDRPRDTRWQRISAAQLVRDQNSGDFPSGLAVQLPFPLTEATTLRVVYAAPYDLSSFAVGTSLVDDLGMPESLVDVPAWGAAYRMLMTREAPRSSSEALGESRRGEEVPPMHITQAATSFKRMRDERLAAEAERLMHRYPIRASGA